MRRTAACQCRAFRVLTIGEPDYVNACHCQYCQRRSGSALTWNAYFPKRCVHLKGDHKVYVREGQQGRLLRNHFCPNCGATVCWLADLRAHHYGVAVGAFNDPSFPLPSVSVWEESMGAWVMMPPGIERFHQAGQL